MKTEPCRSGSAPAAGSHLQPGIPGYRYADLYDPIRLHGLTDEFFRGVEAAEPALVIAWQRYRSAPGALPPRAVPTPAPYSGTAGICPTSSSAYA